MRPVPLVRLAAAAALAALFGLAPVTSGCGSDQGLVGGDCAPGYAPCGNDCCPAGADATTDGAPLDGARDATADVTDAPADRFASDRIVVGPDAEGGAPDAPGTDAPADAPPADGVAVDSTTPDAPVDSPADVVPPDAAEAEAGPGCMPPTPDDCAGVCTDTTTDPGNCGTCGNVCPSQLCQNSMCVGSTAGGFVYVGHDYLLTPFGTAQAHVLSNAVLIPQASPLRVLSYERYANATAVARVKAIINGAALQVGRAVNVTSTQIDGDIPSKLLFTSFQVLVVQDQPSAPTGALATLGAGWAATLATFTQAGGIVVVLDGGTGTGEMPAFSTGTGLLSVTAHSPLAVGTPLLDVAPGDVVGIGVISPYGAGRNSVTFTTEASSPSVIYVIEDPSDAGPGAPVVVHKLL